MNELKRELRNPKNDLAKALLITGEGETPLHFLELVSGKVLNSMEKLLNLDRNTEKISFKNILHRCVNICKQIVIVYCMINLVTKFLQGQL